MFNEYSEKNNLNIILNLNLFTPLNSTIQMKDYGTTVEALLSKKTDKYDIFFYENIYISRYANHFINLKGRVSKEIMDLYSSDLNYKLCTIDDRWVGLVNIKKILKITYFILLILILILIYFFYFDSLLI